MHKCIILDVSNLAYRALHTVGELTHSDNPEMFTGVIYQLRQTCMQLERFYHTQNFAFCFDSRSSIRQVQYPPYKQKRKTDRESQEALDPEAKRRRRGMYQQVNSLPKLLHAIGATNIFGQTGFEADDMLASTVVHNPDTELVIVSTDSDLLQLLRPSVIIYNPVSHKEATDESFQAEWRLPPIQFSAIKAWTGCSSDNIAGVAGVGPKTATKWLLGQIKEENKKYPLFVDNLEVYTRNKPLVTLPYEDTQINRLVEQPGRLNWNRLAEEIGSNNYVPEGLCSDE